MSKVNPFTFLEESLRTFKQKLKGSDGETPWVDGAFIQTVNTELRDLQQLCSQLDKDAALVRRLNEMTDPKQQNAHYYKAAHFFLSDAIGIWEALETKATKRSLFVLASYYDVLRNDHYSDAAHAVALNQLIADPAFAKKVAEIRKQHQLPDPGKQTYLLVAALEDHPAQQQLVLQHFERFIEAAFGLKFKSAEEARSFFPTGNKQAKKPHAPAEGDSLEKVLKELDSLIGLETVKNDIRELINVLKIQKKRTKEGLKNVDLSLHTVFLGPPGTGKTTVARLLSRIYYHLGFLSKGHFLETDREGLVAGYVGQTATKVDKAVEESKGGVLFIDEAYALTDSGGTSDYGAEAVNTLLKRMEDYRDDLVVVVAGYTEPMKFFLESNPGLRSRFSRSFQFEHFKTPELLAIFETFCKNSDFKLTPDAREKLQDTFDLLYEKRDDGFGNARVVRNLFEKCVQNQANRIVQLKKITPTILKQLREEDIPEPNTTVKTVFYSQE